MGNISVSCFVPNPKTTYYKVLGWISRKLRWQDFEFPDHSRKVMKITIAVDRAEAPATSLCRRLRREWHRHPAATGVLWTSSDNITTALTLYMEDV
jgi:hypothetical protein